MTTEKESGAQDCIELFCVTDVNYIPHFAALLKSIERNHKKVSVRVHVILDDVPKEHFDLVLSSVSNITIVPYHITEHEALQLPPLLQISRATYLRLIVEEVIGEDVERLLYLDIDIIVNDCLIDLWNTDLEGMACAAVRDPGVSVEAFSKKYNLTGNGSYFNAGMLLLDMNLIRRSSVFSNALQLLLSSPNAYEFADQDALNVMLWREWKSIDKSWNFQRGHLYDTSKQSPIDSSSESVPKVLHFTEQYKPWRTDEWHPFAWLYWRNLMFTKFFSDVRVENKINYQRLAKFYLKYLWECKLSFKGRNV